MIKAVYPGTFDPFTRGHEDLVRRAATLFDQVVLAIADSRAKPFFTLEERVALLEHVVSPFTNVEVRPFNGLAVRFVREVGARVMLRGLRTTSDMEYEFNMSLANSMLDAEIETVFLMAKDSFSHVSGTLLRQIATFGGPLDNFVPPLVKEALEVRVRELQKVGK